MTTACSHLSTPNPADRLESHLLGLYFLDGTDEVIRSEAVNFDSHGEQQEICKEVNILVCLARLQAR